MATLKMVAHSLCHGDHVVSLDLSDAYFHVRIHPSFRRFLRFQFQGRFYQFCAMPFGLSSSPLTFTKLTRPITLFCRRLGVRVIFYLDDSIIMARSWQTLIHHRDLVLSLLRHLGFLINLEKSDLHRAQEFTFLGLHWNTQEARMSLPEDKVLKLQCSCLSPVSFPHLMS